MNLKAALFNIRDAVRRYRLGRPVSIGVDWGAVYEPQSTKAMREILARELWRYHECPWDFDNPDSDMGTFQKMSVEDQAKGLLEVILNSALFHAKFASLVHEWNVGSPQERRRRGLKVQSESSRGPLGLD